MAGPVPATVDALAAAALADCGAGRWIEALQKVVEALRQHPAGSAEIVEVLRCAAEHFMALDRYDQAQPLLGQAVQVASQVYPAGAASLPLPLLRTLLAAALQQGADELVGTLIAGLLARTKESPASAAAGQALREVGQVYADLGAPERALPLLRRALDLAMVAGDASEQRLCLAALGLLALEAGNSAEAARQLQEAADLLPARPGLNPTALLLNLTLARHYCGDGAKARALSALVATETRARLGEGHPLAIAALNQVAFLAAAGGDARHAAELGSRMLALRLDLLRHNRLALPPAALRGWLAGEQSGLHWLYSLADSGAPLGPLLGLGLAVAYKGRLLDEEAARSRTSHRDLPAADREVVAELREVRAALARRSLEGPGAASVAAYQQELGALRRQSAELEGRLLSRCAPLRALLPEAPDVIEGMGAALQALDPAGVLVEIVRYTRCDFTDPRWGRGGPRYLALVMRPSRQVRAVDLGEAAPLEAAAAALLAALGGPDGDAVTPGRRLYDLLWRPLLPLLPEGTGRVCFAPDGALNLVPLAALHDGRDFLAGRHLFHYLTSGRDLLPRAAAPAGEVVVLADPAFATTPEGIAAPRHAPLPGTRREAEAIRALWPAARVLLGRDASKAALVGLAAPAVLHVATHARFLGGEAGRGFTVRAPGPAPDAMLRGALLLAGADDPGGDGVMTALELAGLDLWGTQLVVLSACETGQGEVEAGDGVYGLRRAVTAAGAETLVMSLWSVDDQATCELMTAYHRALQAGQGRIAALDEAARAVRATRGHPYYWAAFVALGHEGPLRRP